MGHAHAFQVNWHLRIGMSRSKMHPLHRNPITVVVGSPIAVEKNPSPSEELVARVHEQYVAALQDLFDSNKARFGASNATLNILEAHSSHKKSQ